MLLSLAQLSILSILNTHKVLGFALSINNSSIGSQKAQLSTLVTVSFAIVAKLIYKNFSMLFTGDIEKVAEEKIIRKYKETEKLKSNILKVAHHGSKSSSIQQFLEMVKPEIALIGVGEKNTFGHPNGEVLERLNELRL